MGPRLRAFRDAALEAVGFVLAVVGITAGVLALFSFGV